MGLYGQSRVDGKDFEEERELTLKGVLHLGAQTGWVVGDPLAQGGLCNPVVFNLGIAFRVGTHPQLEQTAWLPGHFDCSLSTSNTLKKSPSPDHKIMISENIDIAEIHGLVLWDKLLLSEYEHKDVQALMRLIPDSQGKIIMQIFDQILPFHQP